MTIYYRLPTVGTTLAARTKMADAYRAWAFAERQAGRLVARNESIQATHRNIVLGVLVWSAKHKLVGAPGVCFAPEEVSQSTDSD
jgi:hypothetical protein